MKLKDNFLNLGKLNSNACRPFLPKSQFGKKEWEDATTNVVKNETKENLISPCMMASTPTEISMLTRHEQDFKRYHWFVQSMSDFTF